MKIIFCLLALTLVLGSTSPVPEASPDAIPDPNAGPKAVAEASSGFPSFASFSFHRPYVSGYGTYIGQPYGGYLGGAYNPYFGGYGYYGRRGFGYGGHGYGYGLPWW